MRAFLYFRGNQTYPGMRYIFTILLFFFLAPLVQAQRPNNLKQQVDSLRELTKAIEDSLWVYRSRNEILLNAKFTLEDQRDSVQMLLNNSRYRGHRYRIEALRLKKILESSVDRVDSLQKAYDEIAIGSGATLAEYRKQIILLTKERNSLASKNQSLQTKLSRLKQVNRNGLLALNIKAYPGKIRRNRFAAQSRAHNVDRIWVEFKLTRAPKISPKEQIIIKLFDGTNYEIPLKPYRDKLGKPKPTSQHLIVEPNITERQKLSRGVYSIRLYLTIAEKGIYNQEIGRAEFTLR